jgi:hypothetical protein
VAGRKAGDRRLLFSRPISRCHLPSQAGMLIPRRLFRRTTRREVAPCMRAPGSLRRSHLTLSGEPYHSTPAVSVVTTPFISRDDANRARNRRGSRTGRVAKARPVVSPNLSRRARRQRCQKTAAHRDCDAPYSIYAAIWRSNKSGFARATFRLGRGTGGEAHRRGGGRLRGR